jgi:sugar phosphate isomerase/epimerase
MQYKVGISLETGYPLSNAQQMSIARQAGFDSFFVLWKASDSMPALADQAVREGIVFQSVHAPWNNVHALWHGPDDKAELALNMFLDCVRATGEAGVDKMVIHPFVGFEDHTPTEIGLSRYDRVLEEAIKCNVKLAFENVEGMEYLAALMERYRGESHVGFCWDTGHERVYNFSIDQIPLYGDRLICTHFNDNIGMRDPNVVTWIDDLHLLPFDGNNDWKSIMDRLESTGYNDIITFEMKHTNKPGRHEHDHEADWSCEYYFQTCYERARRVVDRAF